MKHAKTSLDSKQILSIIGKYSYSLDMLDSYVHQTIKRPAKNITIYRISYDECIKVIAKMRLGNES